MTTELRIEKRFNVMGETGTGYRSIGQWNASEKKWMFGEDFDRHDGTGTVFHTREEAENELAVAQDPDVRDIAIEDYEIEIES